MRSNTRPQSLTELLMHQEVRRRLAHPVTADPEATAKWGFYVLAVLAILWTVWIVGNL